MGVKSGYTGRMPDVTEVSANSSVPSPGSLGRGWTVLALLLAQGVFAKVDTVKLQFFEAAPHIFLDPRTGKVGGAAHELLEKTVAPALGVHFDWQLVPIPRQMLNYRTGRNLASAWLAYTPERARIPNLLFTAKPYFPDIPGLAVLKESRLIRVDSIGDILGLKIGYTEGAFTSPRMKDPRIRWEYVPGATFYPANFQKLQRGRVEAVYAGSSATLAYFSRELDIEKQVRIVPLPDARTEHFLVFSADRKDLAEKYDRLFVRADLPSLYLKLLSRYLDLSYLRK